MTKVRLTIILLLVAFYCNGQRVVRLNKTCFFDAQHRKVVDSFFNKRGIVTIEYGNYIVTINKKRYLSCNLPKGYEGKRLLISAYILQELDTEKIIATPIRIIKAANLSL